MKERMKRILLAVLVIALLSARTLPAAGVVRDIAVKGNQRLQTASILATLETKVGQPYSAEKVKHDLRALYRLGAFSDVRVEKSETSGGVRLTYIVEESSGVSKITFQGQKKVKEDKLRELTDVKPFRPVNQAQIESSIRKIRDHYATEGYHLADITTEMKPIPGSPGSPGSKDQELVFQIKEGDSVKIRRINFIGNRDFSDNELQKKIKSREKGYWSWISSGGKFQEEMVKLDTALLVYHYQNSGYLRVKVDAPKIYLSPDRKWITVTYHITEGEKYKVRHLGMQGDVLTTQEEMVSRMTVRPGELYNRKEVEEDLVLLSQLYGDQGYAFANINPMIQPHDEDLTADVVYNIQKGPKVFIERISIIGNTTTRDKVLRRELLVKENTLFNESKLRQSQQKLQALGYFQEVNFATPRGSSDDRIHINISVKEKPTGQFSIGAGFSSVENFIFTASVAKDNFFGYGISGQLSTELSSKRQLFLLSMEDPYFLDTNWILGVSGFRTVNVFTDFDRRSFGGSFTLGHRIFENSIFRLGYQGEDVNVGDFRTTVPARFLGNLSGFTSSSSLSLQRDTRDNRLFPTKGMFNNVSVEYAGLGGDTNFVRVQENFRFYQPIWKGLVGKFNFNIGQITSTKNGFPVPLFERFFMGGVNSLRGYFLRSIGPSVRVPTTPQGGDNRFVYGGNKMMQMNFELEFPLYAPAGFRAVGFIDAGNAFGEDESFSLKLRANYGAGLRWNSPLGPLRFEWGFPFKRQPGENPVIFNFTIGSFF